MEFHDEYPQYEMMAHHDEEKGKVIRKKLWKVFWIMLVITIIELIVGFFGEHFSDVLKKFIFIGFTILKAAYIVLAFMHLGDEKKFMRYTILVPFSLFIIYLVYIIIVEGSYSGQPGHKDALDHLLIHH